VKHGLLEFETTGDSRMRIEVGGEGTLIGWVRFDERLMIARGGNTD